MKILGLSIPPITREEALHALEHPQVIFTPNPEILLEASRRPRLKYALQQGTLLLPDGHGLQVVSTLLQLHSKWLRVLLYFPALMLFLFWKKPFLSVFPEVIHGADFMDDLVHLSAVRGWNVFFLGAQNGAAEKTTNYFQRKYPRLKVAGFSEKDPSPEAFKEVKEAKPAVLFVAYGAPKQEFWVSEYASKLPSLRHVMTVGGSFDFYSGQVKRAPHLLRSLGLEWLWRLITNPIQRTKRIVNALLIFPLTALVLR